MEILVSVHYIASFYEQVMFFFLNLIGNIICCITFNNNQMSCILINLCNFVWVFYNELSPYSHSGGIGLNQLYSSSELQIRELVRNGSICSTYMYSFESLWSSISFNYIYGSLNVEANLLARWVISLGSKFCWNNDSSMGLYSFSFVEFLIQLFIISHNKNIK